MMSGKWLAGRDYWTTDGYCEVSFVWRFGWMWYWYAETVDCDTDAGYAPFAFMARRRAVAALKTMSEEDGEQL